MSRFKILALLSAAATFAFSGCQHGIDPDEIIYPPESDESSIISASLANDDIEKELRTLAKTPYPPYTIQGGDSFRIRVYNEPELDSTGNSPTIVTPDGDLSIGLVGSVCVKDMTLPEATRAVKEALKKFVKFPEVSLIPDHIHGKSATLYGSINAPGSYPVSDNVHLSDFVAKGRGFLTGALDGATVDLADINNSYILRDGKMLPVNFTEALFHGNQLHNIKVLPDDIVYIAKREDSRVVVMGEVVNPRTVNWSNTMTVVDALAAANGLKEDYWGTLLVLRKPKTPEKGSLDVYKVNVDDLLAGRCRNFRVAAGDIIYIPKDSLSEYNVFINKLVPTAQLINLLTSPMGYWYNPRN